MYMHFHTLSLTLTLPHLPPPHSPHTSIIHDELHNILNLLQCQSKLPTPALVAMDPGYHSTRDVAGFDCFEVPIANATKKEECLLTDPHAIVVEHGV